MQYELEVHYNAATGDYLAEVSFQGNRVDEQAGFSNIKDARKWARSAASEHANSMRPTPRESYLEAFSI
jgi:hypothetical protein